MAINIASFKSGLISDLNNGFDSIQDTASGIVDRYEQMITNGVEPIANNTLVINTVKLDILEQGVISAFNASFNANASNSTIFTSTLVPIMVTTWTGVTLGITTPPPGSVQIVSNTVVSPGSATPIPMPSASNTPQPFVDMLANFFQTHLNTITGTINHLVSSPSGPVPGPPIPWVGII